MEKLIKIKLFNVIHTRHRMPSGVKGGPWFVGVGSREYYTEIFPKHNDLDCFGEISHIK